MCHIVRKSSNFKWSNLKRRNATFQHEYLPMNKQTCAFSKNNNFFNLDFGTSIYLQVWMKKSMIWCNALLNAAANLLTFPSGYAKPILHRRSNLEELLEELHSHYLWSRVKSSVNAYYNLLIFCIALHHKLRGKAATTTLSLLVARYSQPLSVGYSETTFTILGKNIGFEFLFSVA